MESALPISHLTIYFNFENIYLFQSSSKPFTYSVCLNELGANTVHQYVGQEPSGRMFNELSLDFNSKFFNSFRSGFITYRHSSIYAVNGGTEKKPLKHKPCKSRLLNSTKGEKNRLGL